jgi:hypothetical protein
MDLSNFLKLYINIFIFLFRNADNSPTNVRQVARIENAEGLLTWFSNFNFTVEALAILLESCKLEEPLYLLKKTGRWNIILN